jgi:hypothetical protein
LPPWSTSQQWRTRVRPTADGFPVVGHLATFTLGYVVLQVLSVDFLAAEQHSADVWNTHVPASLSKHLVRIWPKQLVTPDVLWQCSSSRAMSGAQKAPPTVRNRRVIRGRT